jgi:hypothetical protein
MDYASACAVRRNLTGERYKGQALTSTLFQKSAQKENPDKRNPSRGLSLSKVQEPAGSKKRFAFSPHLQLLSDRREKPPS